MARDAISRGDIWLADTGKSKRAFEFGKKRPVIVLQSDKLNILAANGYYDHILVIPITHVRFDILEEFHPFIAPRDKLQEGGYAACNAVCFLRHEFFVEKLTETTDEEMERIETSLKEILNLKG